MIVETETKTQTNFRVEGRELFATYSQSVGFTKDELSFFLKTKYEGKYSYIIVAEEKHKDGGIHFHVLAQFEKITKVTNPRSWDFRSIHPKIEKIRCCSSCANNYVMKEDQSPAISGVFKVIKEHKEKKNEKKKLTNKELLTCDLKEMIDTESISLFSLPAILKARESYASLCIPAAKPDLPEELPMFWADFPILAASKEIKKRHFWIYSTIPNKGKTTFLEMLDKNYRCYFWNGREEYQKIPKGTECLLFDEYGKGNSLPILVLNGLCDGHQAIKEKNRSATILEKGYVFITSNFPIREVYPNSNGRVEVRFHELCVDECTFHDEKKSAGSEDSGLPLVVLGNHCEESKTVNLNNNINPNSLTNYIKK